MHPDPGHSRPFSVWCLLRDQSAHVQPVEVHLGERARFIYDGEWDPLALINAAPDLVLCVNDWPSEVAACLDAARGAGIPSLVLQDGVLEWRCQYENPLFGAGGGAPQHQPVLADRIACLGAQSARQISVWGNPGKVEVTGMPRLDWLLERPRTPRRSPGKRLLVMTAKNPGFTPEQRTVTLRSLRDLKAYLDLQPQIEVLWRVSRGLVPELGISNQLDQLGGAELVDLIDQADAVVTTPSTAMLEAMLRDRPVAALDYHNVPRFVPTAWTISAPEHIKPIVQELLAPPPSKLVFQRECLEDCLCCDGPASPRVAAVIEQMVAWTRSRRSHGGWPELPAALYPAVGSAGRSGAALTELYPHQSVFGETDLRALQVRVARLQKDNERLRLLLRDRSHLRRLYQRGRLLAERVRSAFGGSLKEFGGSLKENANAKPDGFHAERL